MKTGIRLLAMTAVFTFSATTYGQITGTDHDLTKNPYNLTQICLPCHIPHVPDQAAAGALWNHELSVESYNHYTLLDGTTPGDATGQSKLCLSCHDGSVAIDSYGGLTGSTSIGSGHDVTQDTTVSLTDDHPIGIVYPSGDPGYFTVANSAVNGLPLYAAGAETDRVECGSCHDPHKVSGIAKFLRASMTTPASGLCIKCHDK